MTGHKAAVAVLGAGPAGAIAARQLGLAGVDVVLVDAAPAHRGHAIESFPASGAPLADDIGLLSAICGISDGPAVRMELLWRNTPETRSFEGDGPLLLRRKSLHAVLRAKAAPHVRYLQTRVRKVTVTEVGAKVMTDAGTVHCEMVLDARGRNATKRAASDLVALPFAARVDLAPGSMWLEAQEQGWLWACRPDAGFVHGVVFERTAALSGLTARSRQAHASARLAASRTFAKATAVTVGTPGAAGLSCVDDPVLARRHVLVGDAALARDPIASHGLVHAMRSGVQSAIAARTILDPAGETDAALDFLRHKHTEAVRAARQATSRAYRDQELFCGAFWEQHAEAIAPDPAPALGCDPVTLTRPLTRAPVLDHDRIRWAPAIDMPARQDVFTRFGSVTALDVAAACRPPAPLNEVAARLGRSHAQPMVFEALEHLTLGGAFSSVSGDCPKQRFSPQDIPTPVA